MMVTPSVKLVRPLGEGGMGSVWVADHLALRTQVVVKFIAAGLKGSKEAHDRFSREAAAASQVKSPHVVQTFDHGITDQGTPYIVMELLEGRDLGAYLEEQGRLPPDLVAEMIAQLSRALDRAHERGIVHRDIKPGNIYLCDAGKDGEVFVKLLDFGIAKGVDIPLVDSGTKTGSMIGSPFYMSPEQILGSKDVDHRSDIWSMGVVAFEALTGQKPFDAETMGGLAIKIHSEPLPMPSEIVADLPAAVDEWFKRACARNVAERYASAKECAEDLARALGGHMPRSLVPPRLSTGSGRRPGIAPAGKGADPEAATLAAGAATDAGIVRAAPSSGSRNRVLVLVGIVAVFIPLSYLGVSALLKKPDAGGAALVAEPSSKGGAASGAAGSSAAGSSAVAAAAATPGSATTTTSTAPSAAPVETSAVTGAAVTGAAPSARGNGHGPRPRPKDTGHATTASPPSTTTSVAPPPPKPATSGHDIF